MSAQHLSLLLALALCASACQSTARHAPAEELAPAIEERSDGASTFTTKTTEKSRVRVEVSADGTQSTTTLYAGRPGTPLPAAGQSRRKNPLQKPDKVTTRVRIAPKGYSYDPATCRLGPDYEISSYDSRDDKEQADKERKWRPELKIELPPPEEEAKEKAAPKEAKGQILGTGQ